MESHKGVKWEIFGICYSCGRQIYHILPGDISNQDAMEIVTQDCVCKGCYEQDDDEEDEVVYVH